MAVLATAPDVVLVHCNCDRVDAEGQMLQTGAVLAERASALASPLGRLIGEALITDMLADCYSDWGMHDVRSGNRQEGRTKARQSLRWNPTKLRTYSRLLRACLVSLEPGKETTQLNASRMSQAAKPSQAS